MIISSKLINAATKETKMSVFFIVGIIFLVIGIGKYLLINYLSERQKKKDSKKQAFASNHPSNVMNTLEQEDVSNKFTFQPHAKNHPSLHHSAANSDSSSVKDVFSSFTRQERTSRFSQKIDEPYTIEKTQLPQHLSIIACPACGTKHYSYANFCMLCGSKMKK